MTDPSVTGASGELEGSRTVVLRRRRVLWMFAGGAVAVTGAGLAATRLVRSPAQQVADTAPPARTVLTAVVERRVLADTVVLRGQVAAGTTVEVSPAPGDAERLIVTGVRVEPGEEFDAGTVLLEVSGRPVLALPGAVPAYRDLRPGARGADVVQLQEALASLGYLSGAPDGEYGVGTKAAVAALYDGVGYEAPLTGDAGALSAANQSVRLAERALQEAEEELRRLREAPPSPIPGEPDPVAAAQRRVEFAIEDLSDARQARDEVERTTGAMLPLSEVVYLPDFPARVERIAAVVGRDLAEGDVEGSLLTVSSGELMVRAQVNPAQRELLAEGMPVEIFSELEGITASGEIVSIGERAADPATGARGHALAVRPTEGPLDERLAGADVRLTVATAATMDEVLVVPVSAVFAAADGGVAVLRLDPDGGQRRVVVAAGVSGDGYVSVTPLEGSLAVGDEVVVGAAGAAP